MPRAGLGGSLGQAWNSIFPQNGSVLVPGSRGRCPALRVPCQGLRCSQGRDVPALRTERRNRVTGFCLQKAAKPVILLLAGCGQPGPEDSLGGGRHGSFPSAPARVLQGGWHILPAAAPAGPAWIQSCAPKALGCSLCWEGPSPAGGCAGSGEVGTARGGTGGGTGMASSGSGGPELRAAFLQNPREMRAGMLRQGRVTVHFGKGQRSLGRAFVGSQVKADICISMNMYFETLNPAAKQGPCRDDKCICPCARSEISAAASGNEPSQPKQFFLPCFPRTHSLL